MFVTGLTPILLLGFFCFYTDYYGVPDMVREGLAAIPFLSKFVDKGEAHFHFTACVLLALANGIAIGVCSILAARSITRPVGKARRMIEMMYRGEPGTNFSYQQIF